MEEQKIIQGKIIRWNDKLNLKIALFSLFIFILLKFIFSIAIDFLRENHPILTEIVNRLSYIFLIIFILVICWTSLKIAFRWWNNKLADWNNQEEE